MKSVLFKILITVLCSRSEFEGLKKVAALNNMCVEEYIAADVQERIKHKCLVKVTVQE